MSHLRMYHSGAALKSLISYGRSQNWGSILHINRTFLPVKTVYFLYFAASVSFFPYMPVYMTYLGLTPTQVGIIGVMGPVSNIVTGTPLSMVIDGYAKHKLFLILSVVVPSVVDSSIYFVPHVKSMQWIPLENTTTQYAAQLLMSPSKAPSQLLTSDIPTTIPKTDINFTTTFWVMIILTTIQRIFKGPFYTIMDSSTQKLVQQLGGQFGRQRMWGAIAWGMWSPLAGLAIDSFHPTSFLSNKYAFIFILNVTLSALCMIPVLKIKLPPHERPQSMSRNILSMFLKPLFLMFIITIYVCGVVFGVIYTYLFIFLQDELNCPHYLMGLTLTLTCIAEVPVMFYAKKLIRILGHLHVMNLVVITWGLRLFLYSILQSPFWVLPVELLHGITFGLFYPAFSAFINWISPEGLQMSVQAICYGVWLGLGYGSGMLCGGIVYDTYGGKNLFRAAAVMCLGTFVFMVIAQCALKRGRRTYTELSTSIN